MNELGDINQACTYYNEAIMFDEYEPTALFQLGRIRAVQGREDKAMECLDRLCRIDGAEDQAQILAHKWERRSTSAEEENSRMDEPENTNTEIPFGPTETLHLHQLRLLEWMATTGRKRFTDEETAPREFASPEVSLPEKWSLTRESSHTSGRRSAYRIGVQMTATAR